MTFAAKNMLGGQRRKTTKKVKIKKKRTKVALKIKVKGSPDGVMNAVKKMTGDPNAQS